jgi:hypothetical protein
MVDILLGSEGGGPNVAGRQAMTRSSTKAGVLCSVLGLLVFAGCAILRKTPPSAPPALPVVKLSVPSPTTPSGKTPSAPEQLMLVESVPPGAIIVVDGRPVGKSPLRLAVPATTQGFFLNDVEIRARFVATDATEVSRTAMEEFTPRDKVPVALHFTPEGVQRAAR